MKEICSTFAPLFAISGKKFRRESIRVACEYCVELIQKIKEISFTMDLIKVAEQAFATGKELPDFLPGDTITVAYRIKEGNKERIQQYRGVVIKINGEGTKKRFTVRKISDGIGVERIFPMESPFIDNIVINKYGRVRRAKLYYLRGLTGKKARIKERRFVKKDAAK